MSRTVSSLSSAALEAVEGAYVTLTTEVCDKLVGRVSDVLFRLYSRCVLSVSQFTVILAFKMKSAPPTQPPPSSTFPPFSDRFRRMPSDPWCNPSLRRLWKHGVSSSACLTPSRALILQDILMLTTLKRYFAVSSISIYVEY